MPGHLWPGILLCAFIGLAIAVRGGPLPADAALRAAAPHVALLETLSAIGAAVPWTVGILLVAGLLWITRRRNAAVALVIADLASESTVLVVKLIVDRARPVAGLPADLITSASFPSGHVVRVAVALGIVLLFMHSPRVSLRLAAALAAIGAVDLLALARVASGEHWPSDVLGSLLLAGAAIGLASRFRPPRQAP